MMTMVERVAQTYHEAEHPGCPWGLVPPIERGLYLGYARLTIAAMREPTEAMHEAGDAVISDGEGFPHDKPLPTLRNAYRAMIDAALKE